MPEIKLLVKAYDTKIVVENKAGMTKAFPRCGITLVQPFIKHMVNTGRLDELFDFGENTKI